MRGLVTVFGGSGFIGSQTVRALAKHGWRIRVAVRRPWQAYRQRLLGDVGQIEIVQANVRVAETVERAIEGAEAVVYAVGAPFESGKQSSRGGPRRRAEDHRPGRAAVRRRQAGLHFRDRRRRELAVESRARGGTGGSGGAGDAPRRGDPAPVSGVRPRGHLLQQDGRHGRRQPGDAGVPPADPRPAGVRGRRRPRGRRGARRPASGRPHLRARRSLGLHPARAHRDHPGRDRPSPSDPRRCRWAPQA